MSVPRWPRFVPLVRLLSIACLLSGLFLLMAGAAGAQEGGSETVDLIEVEGVIDPPVADFLTQSLSEAERDGVQAAVIRMDTPGGLDVSMREIVQQMLDSNVPVAVWVAPRGARAASAGTFITYAANLAYMSDATTIGAATPVNLGGGDIDETLSRKITNDAAEYISDLATTRGRNAEFAEASVREAESIGSDEAAERNVVNGIANSPRDVLEQMDGEEVEVGDGSTVTLETWDEGSNAPSVRLRFQNMNLLQQILHTVINPELAYLLILIGAFGLIFELYNPGIGLAGLLGAAALLLGFYALSVLPTNWIGVLLIVLGIVSFIVDLQVAGLGVFTVAGVIGLVVGGFLLFSSADPELAVSPWVIVLAVAFTLIFFISVMTAALRVRLRRPVMGEEALVGVVGEAKTDIAPEGTVLTKGTLWRARTMETGIAAGSKVTVKATEGLVLLVEPYEERHDVEQTEVASP
jgi:membrane-bound serine protease (ClpP class)